MRKTIFLICVSTFLLMFGYNAVEAAYPLHHYSHATGVLSILYMTLTISDIPVGMLISKIPAGTAIIFGPLGYIAFILALLFNGFVIISAILLGFTASVYWVSCSAVIYGEVERDLWGTAFGILNLTAILAGGLGPYLLLTLPYRRLLEISLLFCSISIVPLAFVRGRGKYRSRGLSFKGLANKTLALYALTSFCLSVYYPIVVAYIPLLGCRVVRSFRLFSYALPSAFSLIGGTLYDRIGFLILPIFISMAILSFMNLGQNVILWGAILTLSYSLLLPGFQAYLGEIVKEEELPLVLGMVGFISGVGVSLHIAVIGLLRGSSWMYILLLLSSALLLTIALKVISHEDTVV